MVAMAATPGPQADLTSPAVSERERRVPGYDLAAFLVDQPLVVAANLLAGHVDDGAGKCAGCATVNHGSVPHPCSLRVAAERAMEGRRP
jgi:hypothetical protein